LQDGGHGGGGVVERRGGLDALEQSGEGLAGVGDQTGLGQQRAALRLGLAILFNMLVCCVCLGWEG